MIAWRHATITTVKTLAFAAQKGGAGKTTLAVHLAVAASASRKTLIADVDPQGSATAWAVAREGREPAVYPVQADDLGRLLEAAENDGIELVVIDTAPHAKLEASKVLARADLVIVPMRPSFLDLRAYPATHSIVTALGRPHGVVLSAVPVRSPEADEIEQALLRDGVPCAPVRVRDRIAYRRALAHGQAVSEFPGAREARAEIAALWAWAQERMKA